MNKLDSALAEINRLGLNKFRCYLTGAPYATIAEDEIRIALDAEIRTTPAVTVDRLVDMWQLKSLSFNDQLLPSLRGSNLNALFANMIVGNEGQVRIFTYMLTRLLHPNLSAESFGTKQKQARMMFAIQCYDSAQFLKPEVVADWVQRLAAIDAYCSMPYWHTLWAFESSYSKFGIDKAPSEVQAIFDEPETLFDNLDSGVNAVLKFMYNLMLFIAERDGVAGKSGSRMAQQIMFVHAELVQVPHVPHFQKEVTPTDYQRIAYKRSLNTSESLKIAHSAIHGKGTLAISGKKTTQPKPVAPKPAPKRQLTGFALRLSNAFASVAPAFNPEDK